MVNSDKAKGVFPHFFEINSIRYGRLRCPKHILRFGLDVSFFDNDIVVLQWNNTDSDIVECCVTHELRVFRSVVKETAETLRMKVVQRLIE